MKETLLAFADHGAAPDVLPHDGGEPEAVIAEFARAGVDGVALAEDLQRAPLRSRGTICCIGARPKTPLWRNNTMEVRRVR